MASSAQEDPHAATDTSPGRPPRSSSDPRVYLEQIKQLYLQAVTGLVGMPLCALGLVYVLSDEIPWARLLPWLAAVFVLTLVRAGLMWGFRRRPSRPEGARRWARAYLLLELASGTLWGLSGLFLGLLDPIHQVFAAFVLAGMVGGGTAILAPYLPATVAFVVPATGLFAVTLLTLSNDGAGVMAALTLLYGAVMLSVAALMNRQIRDAIALRFHNADLLEALRESNRQLSAEIKERTLASQQLDRSRAELSAILDNMQDTFFRTDTQGRIAYVTPSVTTLLGHDPSEVLGKKVADFLVEAEAEQNLLQRLQSQGGMVSNFETRLRKRDGQPVWVSINAQFYYDDQGNVRGLEGTLRDVTERRRALDAVFKAKNDYRRLWEFNRTILDNSPVGIIRLDERLRIMYMNQEMRRITGVPEGEESAAIGQEIHQLPTVSTTGLSGTFQALREGRQFSVVTPYTSLYGKTTYLEVLGVPLMEGERFNGAVLVVRDVTEQEEAAQALRRARDAAEASSRAKTTFLANASHELRTPLTGILGTLELLRRSELPPAQRRYVELAEDAARTLAQLVDDLLQLSQGESGKPPRWAPVDLVSALHEDTALLALQARDKGLEFQLHLAADLPEVVYADRQWLRQIVTNLVANAIKFTEQGKITVSLKVDHYSLDRAHIHLTVTDTGIGIPAKDRERIFEPFTQLDDGRDRRRGGSGLGTTIVRELVQRMDGRVWVESGAGRGSRFHVVLPLPTRLQRPDAPQGETPRPEETAQEAQESQDAPPLRVLLMEDNPINQTVVREILEGLGHHVDVVEDGEQGLARWEQGDYDVILMDAQMPGMDGYATTREIRRREAARGLTPIPIVALTAHAFEEDKAACLAAGMDDYLSKPLSIEALDAVLRRIAGQGGRPRLRLIKS